MSKSATHVVFTVGENVVVIRQLLLLLMVDRTTTNRLTTIAFSTSVARQLVRRMEGEGLMPEFKTIYIADIDYHNSISIYPFEVRVTPKMYRAVDECGFSPYASFKSLLRQDHIRVGLTPLEALVGLRLWWEEFLHRIREHCLKCNGVWPAHYDGKLPAIDAEINKMEGEHV